MENNKIDGGINFNNNLNTQNNNQENNKINFTENYKSNLTNTASEIKTIEEINNSIDSAKIEELKNSVSQEIKEEVKPTSTNTKQSYVEEQKSHMTQADLELGKKIEEILNDDLSKVYESLNDLDKKKFEQDKYEASINIIVALKSVGGNIKKAIKSIFEIVHRLINSLKNINNKAFIEKMTKIKVERIIRTQENDINK